MRTLDLFWLTNPEWYDYTDDNEGELFLVDDAPPEARASYERYLEQKKAVNS